MILKRPRLFVLGVFPGVFTFAASAGVVYLLWLAFLQALTLWVSIPALMLLFLASWIVLGNIALLPVEDAIIDECQRALWGEVRLPSPGFSLGRLLREAGYSAFLGFLAILLILVALVPVLAIPQFVLLSWLSAYGFLTPLYARRSLSLRARASAFFSAPFSHFLLGALLSALLFVPVLNVFLLGYAQVVATLLYFHREERPAD